MSWGGGFSGSHDALRQCAAGRQRGSDAEANGCLQETAPRARRCFARRCKAPGSRMHYLPRDGDEVRPLSCLVEMNQVAAAASIGEAGRMVLSRRESLVTGNRP